MQQIEMAFPEDNQPKKRKHNAESKAAYESIKESRTIMYDRITVGLVKLGNGGTFETIAYAAGIKPDQCWKRLGEMITLGIVYNTGETKKTTSGRQAMVRQLKILKKTRQPTSPNKRLIEK